MQHYQVDAPSVGEAVCPEGGQRLSIVGSWGDASSMLDGACGCISSMPDAPSFRISSMPSRGLLNRINTNSFNTITNSCLHILIKI